MVFRCRKRNRFPGCGYSGGWYFVTINSKFHGDVFGVVINGNFIENDFGLIVRRQWYWMVDHFGIWGDEFVVMPDHVHGIVFIPKLGAGLDLPVQKRNNLSKVIGAFKTTSSKLIHEKGEFGFVWQRSFFDEIIKTKNQYRNVKRYVRCNPRNWRGSE